MDLDTVLREVSRWPVAERVRLLDALRGQLGDPGPEALPATPGARPGAPPAARLTTPDEWERLLRSAASDCGVALAHEDVSSEGLYD